MPVIESSGLKWDVDSGEQDFIGPEPDYEPELTAEVLSLIPDEGVFLDVGAHVGHYSIRAAQKASRVYSIEPTPETAMRLRRNVRLNGLDNIVSVLEIAAWNGTARFDIERVHSHLTRGASNRMHVSQDGPVWGARLDDALNQYPLRPDRLDLVKVDVEGCDLQALDGMRGLLAKHRPVILIEDHSVWGYYPQGDLLLMLAELRYDAEPFPMETAYFKAVPCGS